MAGNAGKESQFVGPERDDLHILSSRQNDPRSSSARSAITWSLIIPISSTKRLFQRTRLLLIIILNFLPELEDCRTIQLVLR